MHIKSRTESETENRMERKKTNKMSIQLHFAVKPDIRNIF